MRRDLRLPLYAEHVCFMDCRDTRDVKRCSNGSRVGRNVCAERRPQNSLARQPQPGRPCDCTASRRDVAASTRPHSCARSSIPMIPVPEQLSCQGPRRPSPRARPERKRSGLSLVGHASASICAFVVWVGVAASAVVFGVAAAHVLADVVVGVGPEVGEVLCDLDGALGGREEGQRERHAAVGDARDSWDPLCVTPGGTVTTCLLQERPGKCLADGPPCVLPNSYRPSSTALPPSRHCARLGRAGPAPYHVRPISGPPYTW
jgi:hypothetical protein